MTLDKTDSGNALLNEESSVRGSERGREETELQTQDNSIQSAYSPTSNIPKSSGGFNRSVNKNYAFMKHKEMMDIICSKKEQKGENQIDIDSITHGLEQCSILSDKTNIPDKDEADGLSGQIASLNLDDTNDKRPEPKEDDERGENSLNKEETVEKCEGDQETESELRWVQLEEPKPELESGEQDSSKVVKNRAPIGGVAVHNHNYIENQYAYNRRPHQQQQDMKIQMPANFPNYSQLQQPRYVSNNYNNGLVETGFNNTSKRGFDNYSYGRDDDGLLDLLTTNATKYTRPGQILAPPQQQQQQQLPPHHYPGGQMQPLQMMNNLNAPNTPLSPTAFKHMNTVCTRQMSGGTVLQPNQSSQQDDCFADLFDDYSPNTSSYPSQVEQSSIAPPTHISPPPTAQDIDNDVNIFLDNAVNQPFDDLGFLSELITSDDWCDFQTEPASIFHTDRHIRHSQTSEDSNFSKSKTPNSEDNGYSTDQDASLLSPDFDQPPSVMTDSPAGSLQIGGSSPPYSSLTSIPNALQQGQIGGSPPYYNDFTAAEMSPTDSGVFSPFSEDGANAIKSPRTTSRSGEDLSEPVNPLIDKHPNLFTDAVAVVKEDVDKMLENSGLTNVTNSSSIISSSYNFTNPIMGQAMSSPQCAIGYNSQLPTSNQNFVSSSNTSTVEHGNQYANTVTPFSRDTGHAALNNGLPGTLSTFLSGNIINNRPPPMVNTTTTSGNNVANRLPSSQFQNSNPLSQGITPSLQPGLVKNTCTTIPATTTQQLMLTKNTIHPNVNPNMINYNNTLVTNNATINTNNGMKVGLPTTGPQYLPPQNVNLNKMTAVVYPTTGSGNNNASQATTASNKANILALNSNIALNAVPNNQKPVVNKAGSNSVIPLGRNQLPAINRITAAQNSSNAVNSAITAITDANGSVITNADGKVAIPATPRRANVRNNQMNQQVIMPILVMPTEKPRYPTIAPKTDSSLTDTTTTHSNATTTSNNNNATINVATVSSSTNSSSSSPGIALGSGGEGPPGNNGPNAGDNGNRQRRITKLNYARRSVAQLKRSDLLFTDDDRDTNLHVAVCRTDRSDPYLIKAICERLERENLIDMVNAQNNMGQTPLYLAVSNNDPGKVSVLVQYKAKTSLYAQCQMGYNGAMRQIAAIHCASSKGSAFLNTLKVLLKSQNIEVDQLDSDRHTALHRAILCHKTQVNDYEVINSLPIIEALLSAGANPCLPVQNGRTALMFALDLRHLDVFEKLTSVIQPGEAKERALKTTDAKGDNVLRMAERLKPQLSHADLQRLLYCLRIKGGYYRNGINNHPTHPSLCNNNDNNGVGNGS